MYLFYSVILDYFGNPVHELPTTPNPRQAAAQALDYIRLVPPAMDFQVKKFYVDPKTIAAAYNKGVI
jgi:hypothetical protein